MERLQVSDVAQIYELWNEYAAAFNDGEMERWINLWSVDGLQMPPGARRRVGKTQIQAAMQLLFDSNSTCSMTINTEEVRILGDWAFSHGTYELKMSTMEVGDSTSCSGKFLDILKKQADGSWKIVIDCHNYDEP